MNKNQENESEVIENQRSENRNHGRRKKTFWILGAVAALIIAFSVFAGVNLQKVNNFTKNISAQDSKLLDRETNAISMTSKLSYNDFITETNMISDSRSKLINKVENQKVLLFKNKLDDLKDKLISENENIKTEQLNRLKRELSAIEKKDNIAIGDFINIATNSSLTWKESFDKLDENIRNRDKTMDNIKDMDLLSYTSRISGYIDLLQAENKLVRSYSQLLHAMFNLSVDVDSLFTDYSDILNDKKEIVSDFSEFQTDYKALLNKDKTFWPSVKGLMPSRNLQQAITDFYKKTHDTFKSFLS